MPLAPPVAKSVWPELSRAAPGSGMVLVFWEVPWSGGVEPLPAPTQSEWVLVTQGVGASPGVPAYM